VARQARPLVAVLYPLGSVCARDDRHLDGRIPHTLPGVRETSAWRWLTATASSRLTSSGQARPGWARDPGSESPAASLQCRARRSLVDRRPP